MSKTEIKTGETIVLTDSLIFSKPVINFCTNKQNELLLLDGSGEKIFKSNLNDPSSIDTILLPQKISFLKGIASDNLFIYLFSDNNLYRFDPVTQRLATIIDWQDKVIIYDLTITSESEIFISDNLNNQILFVNSLGKKVKFNTTTKDLHIPSGIVYDNDNSKILVINKAQDRLEVLSRIGNVESLIKLPDPACSNIAFNKDKIFVWAKNQKNLYYKIKDIAVWYQITASQPITNIASHDNSILLLNSSKGIFIYQTN